MAQILLLVKDLVKGMIFSLIFAVYFLAAVLITIVADLIKKIFFRSEVKPYGKSVFITGCDTGFGHALAKRLDSKGFHVFASCLFPEGEGASKLRASCSDRLRTLPLDVRQSESVKNAVKYVKENLGGCELWAVVNNAGISKGFSVELSTMDEFKDVLDVNFLGTVRVTKAFLPLLKESKGRIVNVTSFAGEISLPFFTPYIASKHAAVGFTDCLRHEIEMQGVSVVSVEPESFSTSIICRDTMNQNLNSKLLERRSTTSADEYCDGFEESFKDLINKYSLFQCHDISIAVNDLESAVSLVYPYHTYKPRRNVFFRFNCFCYEVMPRSSQNLTIKIFLFIFFSEFKVLKNIVMKIAIFLIRSV